MLRPWPGLVAARGPGCGCAADSESEGCRPDLAGGIATSLGVCRAGSVVFGDDMFGPLVWPVVQSVDYGALGF